MVDGDGGGFIANPPGQTATSTARIVRRSPGRRQVMLLGRVPVGSRANPRGRTSPV